MTLYQAFVEPLTQAFFQKALLGGSVVALVCGVVGCLVVLRRMAFLGDALSHAMIAGVAGGYLFMKLLFGIEAHAPAMLIGSVLAAVLTVALISFVSRATRIKEDAAIGIMYCGIFGGGVVLISLFRNYIHIDIMHFIMGDVLGVSDADLWVAVLVAALVLSLIVLFFRHFQLVSFDPVMAASIGLPVLLIDYLLTTCVSMVVVSGVSMVGVILVVGLLITPASTAYMFSDRLGRMMFLSGLFGVTSVIGGLYLSIWIDSAGGGAIIVVTTLQFMLAFIVAPRYGLLSDWRRRRRMAPQQLVEDLLRVLLRNDPQPYRVENLVEALEIPSGQVRHAVQSLLAQGLLSMREAGYTLSEKGRSEANRITRAHRLWEAYLEHLGTPVEEVHARAHHLEHIGDRNAVDYLAHSLGHPEHDPHGAEIPQGALESGELYLSMLRTGQQGQVLEAGGTSKEGATLSPGEAITLAGRSADGLLWQVEHAGNVLQFDHAAADRIRVRLAQ